MDLGLRDLHHELHPEQSFPAQQWRKGQVVAFHAGPPRTADITEGGGANTIPGVPLLECCANLTAGDVIWLLRTDDLRVVISREA